VTTRVEYFIIM